MKRKNKTYYDIKPLLQNEANYYILLGMRSNGKSYQVKYTILEDAYKNQSYFVYLRRYKEDIKQYYVESYFADMPIDKITDGVYELVIAFQGFLYFASYNDNGDVVKGQKIGRYCALAEATRYKSNAFVNYKWVVYEEFITDGLYLSDEPDKLQQFISTVARDVNIKVLLIGNTISRVCPYFSEWALTGTLRQKPSTIELYHMKDDKGSDRAIIAVENCTVVENDSKMFFGKATKQILSGEWDVIDSPRLPMKLDKYDTIYELQISYQLFTFNLKLLMDKTGNIFTFIYPAKEANKKGRLISTEFSDNPMQTSALNLNSRMECKIIECFKNNKVCYSDNLTAADFQQVKSQFKFM